MLSAFPTLFSYALVVPFVFRVIVGLSFIRFGYANIAKNRDGKASLLADFVLTAPSYWLWFLAIIEIIGGALLTVGAYTQIVALVFSTILLVTIVSMRTKPETQSLSRGTLFLLLLITASLLFLGPGFYSFDLPL